MMRKAVLWALLVVGAIVLGLAVNVAPVLAGDTVLGTKPFNFDFQHNGGLNTLDSSQAAFAFDGSKTSPIANLKIVEASKDRDTFSKWVNAISHDTLSVGVGDSTAWIPTYNSGNLAILISVNGFAAGAASVPTATFAVSIRGSYTGANGDSVSCGKWYMGRDTLTSVGAVVGSSVVPHGNEFRVPIAYTAALAKVTAAASGNIYSEPATAWIPLSQITGYQWWAPYTQVRVRLISATGGGSGLNTKVSVFGSAMR